MALLESVTLRQSSAHALQPGKSVQHAQDGRICDEPDCTTVLSRYNPAPSCCQHDGWNDAQPQRRRR